ncbi:M56 family metallopeptidase [Sciscionella sediminilitoris]|uniref:M56 family metallopeptidase n=1 Tax=Sciscionella sediminilitoris TaxID=1445613 RepID=UPI0004DFA47B|nr:M56 family metallopeptidase [Sciscionella sp. SE31]
MTLALGLFLAALLIGLLAPRYLRIAVDPGVHPRLALLAWTGSLATMLAAALGSAALLAFPARADVDGIIGMTHTCVNVARSGGVPGLRLIVAPLVGAVLFGALAWFGLVAARVLVRNLRWRRTHLSLVRACGAEEHDWRGTTVFWLDQHAPVAYSLGGRNGTVVVTKGVAELPAPQRAAILAHEHAHLRARHHLLVLAAEACARAFPFLPLCRSAPPILRMLVELSADACAAREHGSGSVRDALRTLADGHPSAPVPALGMSRDAVRARLRWLGPERAPERRADFALTAVFSAVPVLTAIAVSVALVLFYCYALRPA